MPPKQKTLQKQTIKVVYESIQIKFLFESYKTISELIVIIIDKLTKKNIILKQNEVSLFDSNNFELDEGEEVGSLIKCDDTVYLKKSQQLLPVVQQPLIQPNQAQVQPASSGIVPLTQVQQSSANQILPPSSPLVTSSNVPNNSSSAQKSQPQQQPQQLSMADNPPDYTIFLIKPAKKDENIMEQEEEKQPLNTIKLILKFPQFLEPNKQTPFYVNQNLTFSEFSDLVVDTMKIQKQAENICFYNEAGIPYSPSMQQYGVMTCNEMLSKDDVVYCICTNTEKSKPEQISDPDIGKDQLFIKYSKTILVRCDIDKDTVALLKQKIYAKTLIPSQKMYLVCQGKPLKDEHLLFDYNIQNNQTVEVNIRADSVIETSQDLYSPNIIHSHTSTEVGVRALRSHLMILRAHASLQVQNGLLGLIRDLSENNAPLVTALKTLFEKQTMSLANKIALEEGLYIVFAKLLCNSWSNTREETINKLTSQKVFEYSRQCLCLMMKYVSNLNSIPNVWQKREQFVLIDNRCYFSLNPIYSQPVYVTLDNQQRVICDQNYLIKKIENKENVIGIEKLTEDKLQSDTQLTKIFKILKNFNGNNKSVFVWTPDPQHSLFEILPISLNCKFYKDWETVIPTVWEKDYNYKVYNPIELKQNPANPCLTLNENKQMVIYRGPNKDPLKPAWILNIMTGQETAVNPDELAGIVAAHNLNSTQNILQQFLNSNQDNTKSQAQVDAELRAIRLKLTPPTITQDPKEAIVVVMDTSGSMAEEFSVNLTRMGAVKAFFNAFADRTMAYKFQHVISLIFFDSKVQIQCDFTELFLQFKELINCATPRTNTRLFDALDKAVESLLTLKKKYPAVITRIITLTDGEDNMSNLDQVEVARKIIGNKIILDSFVVGGDCDELKSITLVSGGKCFFPQTLEEGIKLFEVETILCSGIRKQPEMQNEINLDEIEQLLDDNIDEDFSKEGHELQLPLNINKPVYNVVETSEILNNPELAVNPSQRLKRIMKELANLIQNPHPNFKVLPVTDDITFWKVLLVGPEGTPYENGSFILYISFSENYPNEPPKIRFLTSIYHCNINSQGRICHSVLDRNYLVDTTVRQVFDCIYGLLMTPEPEDPLDSTIASEFMTDLVTYQHKAKQLTMQKAMQSDEAIVKEVFGGNEAESEKYKKQIVDWLIETKKLKKQ